MFYCMWGLLMTWLLVWPGHQQPRFWFLEIDMFLSSLRANINRLLCFSYGEWYDMQIHFHSFFQKISVYDVQSVSVIWRLITQHHGWWWPGSARSQGIIIDMACPIQCGVCIMWPIFSPILRIDIARPWGQVIGWLLWVWSLLYVLLLSMLYAISW